MHLMPRNTERQDVRDGAHGDGRRDAGEGGGDKETGGVAGGGGQ